MKKALSDNSLDIRKQTMRRIISGMSLGKDVSILFPYIIKNIETNNMELKKLIYLYIINHAKNYPEMSIMSVNSFSKDAMDKSNPFNWGVAIRTMGCLKIKEIIEYLREPLMSSIKDPDAYVWKSAVLCIAKLYDTNPQFAKEEKFLEILLMSLKDPNIMVITNAI